jgi:hypothetical protein
MMKKTLLIAVLFLAFALIGASSAEETNAGPLKVFILSGQSNMQGHAQVRTFDHIGMDPKTAPMLQEMRNADGSPHVCENVWISSIGCAEEEQIGQLTVGFGASASDPKIGPEFTFGIYMEKLLGEPILIIKTAWGGKSINTDFRPPSAGPYEFNEAQLSQIESQGKDLEQITAGKAEATGVYYRLMIDHVNTVLADVKRVYPDYDPEQGCELAGFVWFQGWNDMVDSGTYQNRYEPSGYDQYSEVLTHFIRDVRTDLNAPELPFVIGVMGAGGPVDEYPATKQRYAGVHQYFRDAMAAPAALPEFEGNVVAVLTEDCWDVELSELQARNGQINAKAKELREAGELSREEQEAALEEFRAELFTPRELEALQTGISNAEYHYLGSAKVLGQIGKAFAETLVEMQPGDQE